MRGFQLARWVGPRLRRWVAPLSLGLFILVGFLHLLPRLRTSVLHGILDDQRLHEWQYWWVHRALRDGGPVFSSRAMTFPAEIDLLSLWGGHLDLLAGVPLVGWLGATGAANVVLILFSVVCGLCVYMLGREISGSMVGGAAGAALYMLTPVVMDEAYGGRVEELCFGFVALFLLYSGRWLREGRIRALVLSAVFAGVGVFAYYGTALTAAFLLPVLAMFHVGCSPELQAELASPREPPGRELIRRIGWQVGILLALSIPVLVVVLTRIGTQWSFAGGGGEAASPSFQEWLQASSHFNTRLEQVVTPDPWHPGHSGCPSLGRVLPLIVAITLVGMRRQLRRLLPWLAGAVVLTGLALGAVFYTSPNSAPIPSPYLLLPKIFPFFLRFHHPYRFLLLAGICLSVIAAIGIGALDALLRERFRSDLPRLLLVAVIAAGTLAQVHGRFPYEVVSPPDTAREAFEALRRSEPRAILVVGAGGVLRPGHLPVRRVRP